MKERIKSIPWIVFVAIFGIVLFYIGNRAVWLYNDAISDGMNIVNGILFITNDFLKSFGFSYYFLGISFKWNALLGGLVVIALAYFGYMYNSTKRRNFREKEEHGSARYGKIESEASELSNKDDPFYTKIYSQNIDVSLNTRDTFLNDNTLIIGGSGSGKTRYYLKPNALNLSCNYVISDPKDEVVHQIGKAFYENYYSIKYLNVDDMTKSMHYNPLNYIYEANDVFSFVNTLVESTNKSNQNAGGDEFFEKAEIALLTCLIFYVLGEVPENERNMNSVMDLIDMAEASEEDETKESELDGLFKILQQEYDLKREEGERIDKNSYSYLALRQYNLYKKAAGKTAKSILISVGVRMQVFNLPQMINLLRDDELHLEDFANPKTIIVDGKKQLQKSVLFVAISDSDSSFHFLATIIFQQLFNLLYKEAKKKKGQRLPIHTRFMLDEFANVAKMKDFEKIIATVRSREISVDVIIQNLAQLKNAYKDSWETIEGNCDVLLFLGGKEYSTLERLSKIIGNTTVDYISYTQNKGGQSQSYSINNQLISRALLAPDEIGRLARDECLVNIRGYHIFRDKKYNLLQHPNIDYTTDGEKGDEMYFDTDILINHKVYEADKPYGEATFGAINEAFSKLNQYQESGRLDAHYEIDEEGNAGLFINTNIKERRNEYNG